MYLTIISRFKFDELLGKVNREQSTLSGKEITVNSNNKD